MSSPLDFGAFFETYKSAVFNKDVDRILELYDQEFMAFDLWEKWSYVGEGAWREMNEQWLGSLGSESVLVEFEDIRIIPGADAAAASATISFKALSEGGKILRSMQNRLTWVVRPKDGVWKIVHQHTSAPIDASSMKVKLHR